ncbi:hypothetical protein [Planctomycetes bacterium K23_9]|uniref:Uncharacterized protein n=1 Tax=Stieleria marina TaxID=1930275 RepID=A0A517NVJ8_9BACT|nr:hypothetical protein K239x_31470 [Planctomycetes bacterium K23_9]
MNPYKPAEIISSNPAGESAGIPKRRVRPFVLASVAMFWLAWAVASPGLRLLTKARPYAVYEVEIFGQIASRESVIGYTIPIASLIAVVALALAGRAAWNGWTNRSRRLA